MEDTKVRSNCFIAILLVLVVVSQPIYTALFLNAPDVDRSFLWRFEGVAFVLMAAFAGSAAITYKRFALVFSAIAFAAVLKLLAVGLGLTQFGPFASAATLNSELSGIATSILALSFFCYNSGNMLLGLASLAVGRTLMGDGSRELGGVAALTGVAALITNSIVMMFGYQGILPSPIAGGLGVLATLFLALCLFRIRVEY